MIKKPTNELMDALNQCSSASEYINKAQDYLIDSTISDYLNQLLDEKALKKSTVIKNTSSTKSMDIRFFQENACLPVTN